MREESGAKRKQSQKHDRDRVAGLAGLVDFFRSVPDRLRRPESLLLVMALLASLGAHMPPYVGLGALAEYFEKIEKQRPKPLPPAEVSFEVTEAPRPDEPQPVAPPPEEPKPERHKVKPKPEPEKVVAVEPEKPKPEPEDPKVSKVEIQQPPPAEERKQSVTQKSEDPDVEPPPDAKFLAEENSRVEEETVAMITDEHHNDDEPTPSAPQAAGPEESGDAHRDEKGADKGVDEPKEDPVKVASVEPRPTQPPPAPAPEPPPPQPQPTPKPAVPEIKPQQPTPTLPEGTVIHDPMGSFTLAPAVPGQAGRKGQAGTQGQKPQLPNIKVSWRAFEETFGEEQLAQDRLPREAKRRGAGREKKWQEFKAAIENYVVGVKPGNQSRLNAAADPFAAYLAAFHRNLHGEFAYEFLGSLPALGELGDMSLVTKVEIVVNPDGSLDRVGVVKSSGNTMYDFGAFNAVQRGAPYPPPPEKIRSPDGRVYMRWALHRNESQCGTWNAEPYILKNPPRSPNDPKPDNVSPYRPTGRDPSDGEHGRAPQNEPAQPAPAHPSAPAPRPGETLGRMRPRSRASKA